MATGSAGAVKSPSFRNAFSMTSVTAVKHHQLGIIVGKTEFEV